MLSVFKLQVKHSVPWQLSKIWRPQGLSGLNTFSVKSKLILQIWKHGKWLAEAAENRTEEEGPGGQNEASLS